MRRLDLQTFLALTEIFVLRFTRTLFLLVAALFVIRECCERASFLVWTVLAPPRLEALAATGKWLPIKSNDANIRDDFLMKK